MATHSDTTLPATRSPGAARRSQRGQLAAAAALALLCFAGAGRSIAGNVTVGQDSGDIVGADSAALQAAVDRAARSGSGTVFVRPGTYLMHDALNLKSNVNVVGMGAAPVLQNAPSISVALAEDAGHGTSQLRVTDGAKLAAGMGIAVLDDANATGWYVATRSITNVTGGTVTLDQPLELEYLLDRNARIETVHPVIAGRQVKNCRLENLVADGSRYDCQCLTSVRGAALYIWRGEKIIVDNCVARNFNGDGISLQLSTNVALSRCQSMRNAGAGISLGAAVDALTMTACEVRDNTGDGLVLAWKVTGARIADCTIEGNDGDGIALAHQSTDNTLMGNTVALNGRHGISFRAERAIHGAHRNTLQDNVIRDNGQARPGDAINIQAQTFDITIIGNTLEDTSRDGRVTQQNGIYLAHGVDGIKTRANVFRGLAVESIVDESSGQRNSIQG